MQKDNKIPGKFIRVLKSTDMYLCVRLWVVRSGLTEGKRRSFFIGWIIMRAGGRSSSLSVISSSLQYYDLFYLLCTE